MSDKTPITKAGHKKLQEELKFLKTVERPRLSKAIEIARAHGDLKENAEYHAAKDEQGLSEARIRHIEAQLGTAQVIDVETLSGERVVFGATVLISDVDTGEEREIMIVGESESNTENNRISFTSPIAKGLIGKSVDDIAIVRLPNGKKEYEILAVRFSSYEEEQD